MSDDESSNDGGRLLARRVLAASGSGDRATVEAMLEVLDAPQLRALVEAVAEEAHQQAGPVAGAYGPAAVCAQAIEAAAPMFGTTPEAIRSSDRSGPVADARAVAMAAARGTGLTLRAIGDALDRDHSSVNYAVQRAAERPRLADAAAQVSDQLASRRQALLPRREVAQHSEPEPAGGATAAGVPTPVGTGPLEHAVAGAAKAFAIPPEDVLGEDRHRGASDARAVAMTAARIHGCSLPEIARHFDRHHTSVLEATRRIEQLPPLYVTASQIASEIPKKPPAGSAYPPRGGRLLDPGALTRAKTDPAARTLTRGPGAGVAHAHQTPPPVAVMVGRGPTR